MQIRDVLVAVPPSTPSFKSKSSEFGHHLSVSSLSRSVLVNRCSSFGVSKIGGIGAEKCRARGFTVRASTNPSDHSVPVSPLQFESQVGLLLAQILQTHPHLLPAAIDQHLEKLQADRDAQKEETTQAIDLLSKRIAEVREKERRNALEEIIYTLIVQKFLDNGISMIPKISATSDPTGRVDFGPYQEQKLESVHSPEAFEMILSHLAVVLGDQTAGPPDTVVDISKIKLGKLYAASIMYGYFLRRVDERFQLERSMNTLPEGFGEEQRARYDDPTSPANQLWDADSLMRLITDEEELEEGESDRLRSYVMCLDAETLQRYATIRSKESISLIEKQTQALFGRPDIRVAEDGGVEMGNDEMMSLSLAGLIMLVLEAVALGSFLWDAESYVESKCEFLNS